MRILVLAKRQYMGKDLLDDRFGRFWELPLELARRGHQVRGVALSYRAKSEGTFTSAADGQSDRVEWQAVNLLHTPWSDGSNYLNLAAKTIHAFQPDLIWACSDAYQAILGHRLAKRGGAKLVVDLYDNFESYPATRIPGIRFLFRRALRAANGVTCVSAPLGKYVRDYYQTSVPIFVLENAIRADLFYPMGRQDCRARLGLPVDAKIIGTAGALAASRGIDTLYRAFATLAAEDDTLRLALAGPRPPRNGIPRDDRIHDLDILPAELVPTFFNALNVAVVCNRDSSFGRYTFPQKAREIIACGVAIVGAEVGAMKEIVGGHRQCLFVPDDSESLAHAIRGQLTTPTTVPGAVPAWSQIAKSLEAFFASLWDRRK